MDTQLPAKSGLTSFAFAPGILAHGTGAAGFDEFFIFGGIGLIIGVLIFMSWRAGRKRKKAMRRRKE